jgi:hypothetical protein
LSALQNFAAINNFISGILPAEFGGMTSLIRIALANNNLSGDIPEGVWSG